MNDLRTAAQQALEALEAMQSYAAAERKGLRICDEAIPALRAALAQQAEPVEPYCYIYEYDGVFGLHREFYPLPYNGMKPSRTVPVYTAPPQRKPLTDEEIEYLAWAKYLKAENIWNADTREDLTIFARAIERAHGITDPQVKDRLARHGIPMPEAPTCPDCHGIGYDASGQTCACQENPSF